MTLAKDASERVMMGLVVPWLATPHSHAQGSVTLSEALGVTESEFLALILRLPSCHCQILVMWRGGVSERRGCAAGGPLRGLPEGPVAVASDPGRQHSRNLESSYPNPVPTWQTPAVLSRGGHPGGAEHCCVGCGQGLLTALLSTLTPQHYSSLFSISHT